MKERMIELETRILDAPLNSKEKNGMIQRRNVVWNAALSGELKICFNKGRPIES